MSSSSAWQLHGCYNLGADVYVDMPFESSADACHDDSVSLDHRDPAKPMRNVLKRMFELRLQYPVLNDGFNLTTLSKQIYNIYLPGSKGIPSPHGLWSVYRGRSENVQDFAGIGEGNQGVWLLYSNENRSVTFEFDCSSTNTSLSLISAFDTNTTVKNLFYPYEEFNLEDSAISYGIEGSKELNGCLPRLEMAAWGYKALVPKSSWQRPRPTITRTVPSHDSRIKSTVAYEEKETVSIEIRYSSEMDCDVVRDSISIDSSTQSGFQASLIKSSVQCVRADADPPRYVAEVPTAWIFRAKLENVYNGVHVVTTRNASTEDGKLFTNANDRFMFRIGQPDNPMVFLKAANYSSSLLNKDHDTGELFIAPRAPGADKLRYSRNWGSSYSDWIDYTGDHVVLENQPWSGAQHQAWDGEHVIVNYWSKKTASSDHVQHSGLDRGDLPIRRFPHVFVEGPFNSYGFDGGIPHEMSLDSDGSWGYDLASEFPSSVVFNVWGINPDGFRDKSQSLGDVDRDGVLDWLPPDSLAQNIVKLDDPPPRGYLGYRLVINDGTYRYHFVPIGSSAIQTAVALLLVLIPLLTAVLGIWIFMKMFCQIKFNRKGIAQKKEFFGFLKSSSRSKSEEASSSTFTNILNESKVALSRGSIFRSTGTLNGDSSSTRRSILIATLEYEIEDWNIKIKIGGLGVMSSLMGKHLCHHDLIWVVPCVGDIDYPSDASKKLSFPARPKYYCDITDLPSSGLSNGYQDPRPQVRDLCSIPHAQQHHLCASRRSHLQETDQSRPLSCAHGRSGKRYFLFGVEPVHRSRDRALRRQHLPHQRLSRGGCAIVSVAANRALLFVLT
jgi:alpha-1,3-glucan synthase